MKKYKRITDDVTDFDESERVQLITLRCCRHFFMVLSECHVCIYFILFIHIFCYQKNK